MHSYESFHRSYCSGSLILIENIGVPPLHDFDIIVTSSTLPVSTAIAATTPDDETKPLFCHVPSTETDTSTGSVATPFNYLAASNILLSATTCVASYTVLETLS